MSFGRAVERTPSVETVDDTAVSGMTGTRFRPAIHRSLPHATAARGV